LGGSMLKTKNSLSMFICLFSPLPFTGRVFGELYVKNKKPTSQGRFHYWLPPALVTTYGQEFNASTAIMRDSYSICLPFNPPKLNGLYSASLPLKLRPLACFLRCYQVKFYVNLCLRFTMTTKHDKNNILDGICQYHLYR
jgi:hypothetical protein